MFFTPMVEWRQMGVENKYTSLGCSAVCCDSPIIDMNWSEFQEFAEGFSDARSIQEVPLNEFLIKMGDTTLAEGIYYAKVSQQALVFISGPCPELEKQACGVWGKSRRPKACADLPIGSKLCLYKREQANLFDLTKGIP